MEDMHWLRLGEVLALLSRRSIPNDQAEAEIARALPSGQLKFRLPSKPQLRGDLGWLATPVLDFTASTILVPIVVARTHSEFEARPPLKPALIELRRIDVDALWPEPSSARSKGGRPPKIDWSVLATEAFRLMDHHGDFATGDKEWGAQARLEEALADYCERSFGDDAPSVSVIRKHIPEMLDQWRRQRKT